AHDYGIQNAVGIERELILAQNPDLLRPRDGALRRLNLSGQNLHERRLARSIGTSDGVPPPGLERSGYVFKQNASAVAHGNIVDRNQGKSYLLQGFTGSRPGRANSDQRVALLYRAANAEKFTHIHAIEDARLVQPGPARLVYAVPDQVELAGAVRVCGDCDLHARLPRQQGVFRREVQPVRARVDFEKTAILLRVFNDAFDIDLITRALQ